MADSIDEFLVFFLYKKNIEKNSLFLLLLYVIIYYIHTYASPIFKKKTTTNKSRKEAGVKQVKLQKKK